jgi:hypothetical protein
MEPLHEKGDMDRFKKEVKGNEPGENAERSRDTTVELIWVEVV